MLSQEVRDQLIAGIKAKADREISAVELTFKLAQEIQTVACEPTDVQTPETWTAATAGQPGFTIGRISSKTSLPAKKTTPQGPQSTRERIEAIIRTQPDEFPANAINKINHSAYNIVRSMIDAGDLKVVKAGHRGGCSILRKTGRFKNRQ